MTSRGNDSTCEIKISMFKMAAKQLTMLIIGTWRFQDSYCQV